MELLEKFNDYCNLEFASMPHGMPVSCEHLQSIVIRSAIQAFNQREGVRKSIAPYELEELADLIEEQGDRTVQEVSEVHRQAGLDAL
jgi:hypothetical protein